MDRAALLDLALQTARANPDPPLDRVYPGNLTAAAAATAEDMLLLLLAERGAAGLGAEELLQANRRRYAGLALDAAAVDRGLAALLAAGRVQQDGAVYRPVGVA